MYTQEILEEKGIILKQIELEDCTQEYVDWLNNPEINQYLESRHYKQTIDSTVDFVKSIIKNKTSYMFKIIYENKHIGNIKINIANERYKIADVGYVIGDKAYWNKGITTVALKLVTSFGFKKLNLHKIFAGVIDGNVGSQKVLSKLGFKQEAHFREHNLVGGVYKDVYEYAVLEKEWSY